MAALLGGVRNNLADEEKDRLPRARRGVGTRTRQPRKYIPPLSALVQDTD